MGGRLFLLAANPGFEAAYAALARGGAGPGDGVLVFAEEPVTGPVRAEYEGFRGYAAGRHGVRVHGLVEVSLEGGGERAAAAVLRVARAAVEDGGYGRLSLWLPRGGGGGLPGVLVFAVSLQRWLPWEVWLPTWGGAMVPLAWRLPPPRDSLPGRLVEALRAIAEDEGVSVEALAERLGVSVKTAANRVSELIRLGLVARKGRGRSLYPTGWGALLSEALSPPGRAEAWGPRGYQHA